MREKLIRLSEFEYNRLLELHKKYYPDSWKYVPVGETVYRAVAGAMIMREGKEKKQ